jgi:hypothetical protein
MKTSKSTICQSRGLGAGVDLDLVAFGEDA